VDERIDTFIGVSANNGKHSQHYQHLSGMLGKTSVQLHRTTVYTTIIERGDRGVLTVEAVIETTLVEVLTLAAVPVETPANVLFGQESINATSEDDEIIVSSIGRVFPNHIVLISMEKYLLYRDDGCLSNTNSSQKEEIRPESAITCDVIAAGKDGIIMLTYIDT
jgi:hypothetical protein